MPLQWQFQKAGGCSNVYSDVEAEIVTAKTWSMLIMFIPLLNLGPVTRKVLNVLDGLKCRLRFACFHVCSNT